MPDFEFMWRPQDQSFILMIDKEEDFSSADLITIETELNQIKASGLKPDIRYYWKVVGVKCYTREDSPVWWFELKDVSLPGAAQLVRPEDLSTNMPMLGIVFEWETTSYTDNYLFQLSAHNGFSNINESINIQHKNNDNITYTLENTLECDKTYYWRVISSNEFGTTNSKINSFDTEPCTGIAIDDFSKNSVITPNPATYYLEIAIPPLERGSGGVTPVVRVFNVLGVEVMTASIHPMTQSHRMNIESLPTGVYFVQIGSRVQRFVKM